MVLSVDFCLLISNICWYDPVVQWIGHGFAKTVIWVRFSSGSPWKQTDLFCVMVYYKELGTTNTNKNAIVWWENGIFLKNDLKDLCIYIERDIANCIQDQLWAHLQKLEDIINDQWMQEWWWAIWDYVGENMSVFQIKSWELIINIHKEILVFWKRIWLATILNCDALERVAYIDLSQNGILKTSSWKKIDSIQQSVFTLFKDSFVPIIIEDSTHIKKNYRRYMKSDFSILQTTSGDPIWFIYPFDIGANVFWDTMYRVKIVDSKWSTRSVYVNQDMQIQHTYEWYEIEHVLYGEELLQWECVKNIIVRIWKDKLMVRINNQRKCL